MAKVRFSTDILRRLGEELNPNIDQGILELVKNAYDADADECTVDLTEARPGGRVVITDDGRGMSEEDILNGWLVLGRSRKMQENLTPGGRIPAGNKGLGRLAALRMGDVARLESRRRGKPELVVELDWKKFESTDMVDKVEISLVKRLSSAATLERGSRITIENLRRKVGRAEVKRLSRAMILLADPFAESVSGFQPRLIAPEYEDLAKMVAQRYFGDADFHLEASVKEGMASAVVRDWRGEVLWQGDHAALRGPKDSVRAYETPDATFDFWAFLLNPSTFTARSASIRQIREWLSNFGGTHVYWNGLRVAPYGDAGDDWLGINLSRVRNPEERPSTNNSIGRIVVIDRKGRLQQTTDRGEFVHNAAFGGLKAFAVDSLDWMASQRLQAAETRRAKNRSDDEQRSSSGREDVQREIDRTPNSSALSTAFARYDKARQAEADTLRREIQLYRTLSTAGITAATFAHESQGNPIKVLEQSTQALERRTRHTTEFDSKLKGPIESIKRAISSLGVLSATTLRLVDRDKRRVGRVDLHDTVRQVVATFQPFLAGREVTVELDVPEAPSFLIGTEAAIESIVTNLINNSLTAFEKSAVARRLIRIKVEAASSVWELRVADNGPGIEDIGLKEIWLPGASTRDGGTGLGLTIVRDAVSDLSGEVSALAHGELGGAEIVVRIPMLEVKS